MSFHEFLLDEAACDIADEMRTFVKNDVDSNYLKETNCE